VTKLQSFRYEGDQKNFNFDKYVTLHVEQHNQHSDLTEYGVKPLDESLKIHWFKDGIKCMSLDAVKAVITTNKERYSQFDSIKDAYVDFKHTMTPTLDPRTRQVATVGTGRCGGGHSRQTGCGAGQQTGDSRKKGLVPQSEIDKQMHITNRDYSTDEHNQLTPAKKAKLWQLCNPNKTPGIATIDELNSLDHPRLHLSSKTLTWDPLTTLFEEQETTMTDYSGNIISNAAMRGLSQMLINNELHSLTTNMADMMHDHNFHQVLASHAHVIISSVDASLSGHVRSHKSASIDFKTLMAWGTVSPECALRTIQLTMQRGVAHASTPILHNDSRLMIGCVTISGSHI